MIRIESSVGLSNRFLSEKYDVCHQLISDVVNYKVWKHVT